MAELNQAQAQEDMAAYDAETQRSPHDDAHHGIFHESLDDDFLEPVPELVGSWGIGR